MSNYFVSNTIGNDSTGNGSLATPWKTIGKAIGPTPAITLSGTGDTLYIAPGTYRETVTVSLTPTSAGPLTIIGDVANAQGFSGVIGGPVTWTDYTPDDKTGPSAPTITLNGKSYLTFQNIYMVGSSSGNASVVEGQGTTGSTNITFTSCAFTGVFAVPLVAQKGVAAGGPDVWLFDRCWFIQLGQSNILKIATDTTSTSGSGKGSDYDRQITLQNCMLINAGGGNSISMSPSVSSNNFKPGGLVIKSCTVIGSNSIVSASSGVSPNIPIRVQNCVAMGASSGINAVTAATIGQIVECANFFRTNAGVRSNVAADPNTLTGNTYAPLIHFGQEAIWGGLPQYACTPLATSPDLGWSNTDYAVGYASTAADDATVGTIAWTTPSNALVREFAPIAYAVATSIPATTGISHYLTVTNFGSLVPSGATIKSVRVEVIGNAAATSAINFSSVKLIKGGVISGNDHSADSSATWASDVLYTLGTAVDPLWGLTLTSTDVNATNFGVAISMKNTSAGTVTVNIDLVRIIVGYTTSTPLAVDLLNKPRPAGGALNAIGAMERGNTGVQDTTTVRTIPGSSIKLTGPSYHEFQVPVDAVSNTLSVWARYDTSGNTPEFRILAAPELGIASDVIGTWTDPGTGVWAQIKCGAQTPTSKGVLLVRMRNTGTSATANVWFDDVGID